MNRYKNGAIALLVLVTVGLGLPMAGRALGDPASSITAFVYLDHDIGFCSGGSQTTPLVNVSVFVCAGEDINVVAQYPGEPMLSSSEGNHVVAQYIECKQVAPFTCVSRGGVLRVPAGAVKVDPLLETASVSVTVPGCGLVNATMAASSMPRLEGGIFHLETPDVSVRARADESIVRTGAGSGTVCGSTVSAPLAGSIYRTVGGDAQITVSANEATTPATTTTSPPPTTIAP